MMTAICCIPGGGNQKNTTSLSPNFTSNITGALERAVKCFYLHALTYYRYRLAYFIVGDDDPMLQRLCSRSRREPGNEAIHCKKRWLF